MNTDYHFILLYFAKASNVETYRHAIFLIILFYNMLSIYVLQVNSIGAEVLEFISDYGKPGAPIPAAIVACVPKKVHTDGLVNPSLIYIHMKLLML